MKQNNFSSKKKTGLQIKIKKTGLRIKIMKETKKLEIGTEKKHVAKFAQQKFYQRSKKTFLRSKHFISVGKKIS